MIDGPDTNPPRNEFQSADVELEPTEAQEEDLREETEALERASFEQAVADAAREAGIGDVVVVKTSDPAQWQGLLPVLEAPPALESESTVEQVIAWCENLTKLAPDAPDAIFAYLEPWLKRYLGKCERDELQNLLGGLVIAYVVKAGLWRQVAPQRATWREFVGEQLKKLGLRNDKPRICELVQTATLWWGILDSHRREGTPLPLKLSLLVPLSSNKLDGKGLSIYRELVRKVGGIPTPTQIRAKMESLGYYSDADRRSNNPGQLLGLVQEAKALMASREQGWIEKLAAIHSDLEARLQPRRPKRKRQVAQWQPEWGPAIYLRYERSSVAVDASAHVPVEKLRSIAFNALKKGWESHGERSWSVALVPDNEAQAYATAEHVRELFVKVSLSLGAPMPQLSNWPSYEGTNH